MSKFFAFDEIYFENTNIVSIGHHFGVYIIFLEKNKLLKWCFTDAYYKIWVKALTFLMNIFFSAIHLGKLFAD
jgi:hypothetical protein